LFINPYANLKSYCNITFFFQVKAVFFKEGMTVDEGDVIVELE
jgi:hypothetical protein